MNTMMNTTILNRGMMTPMERQKGRFMRAPDHAEGGEGATAGGTQVPGGDNGAGNGGAAGANAGSNPNNDGSSFDPASFWLDPPADSGSGSGRTQESATDKGPGGGSQDKGDPTVTALTTKLASLNLGQGLMSQQVIDELADGKTDAFHKNIGAALSESVKQSVLMSATVMEAFGNQMLERVTQMLDQKFNGRDDNDALVKDFPAAANPKVAPVIRSVFGRALTHTKGDRAAAVAMTKDMMKVMATEVGTDLNLRIGGNQESDDTSTQRSPTNWVKELVGR